MSAAPSTRKAPLFERRAANTNSSSRPRPSAPRDTINNNSNSGEPSPMDTENSRNGATNSKRSSRDFKTTEQRHTERHTTTTKERIHVRQRSPIKETRNAGGRRDWEKERMKRQASFGTPVQSPAKMPREENWDPRASLIPHSAAPLSSRVSVPPLASLIPKILEPPPLKDMSVSEQESAVMDDVLYVLMGYEGQYIQFAKTYDPSDEKSSLLGPDFQIAKGLDPSLRDLTTSMLMMAKHYSAIQAFVQLENKGESGAVTHALCAAIRKHLQEYLVLIAQLETQLLTNADFTLHLLHLHTIPISQSLHHLYNLAQEMLKRNSYFAEDDGDESFDDFDDADKILERLQEDGQLMPGASQKKKCTGGKVLALLTERLAQYSGDPSARDLLQTLLREASRPYMKMLNEWLHRGTIKDPHSEFLIRESSGIRRERLQDDYTDEYWEKRYTLRESEVPPQLESVKEKVLLAGKYLNVVRECGGVDISKEVGGSAPRTVDDPRFIDNVNEAYAFANAELLNLLLTKSSLTTRLRSLKHYFFLDRSDFFAYFLELSTSELKKSSRMVNVTKLQSLLDLVLRQPGSIAAQDPYKEDVKVQMNQQSLTKWLMQIINVSGFDQDNPDSIDKPSASFSASTDDSKDLSGFESLELDYRVPFPLSLVISRNNIIRYQMLFRFQLSLRHLETLLVNSWTDHSKVGSWSHKSSDRRIEFWKRRAWTLRARMLAFIQQLLYFVTVEVIEPNWKGLMSKVENAYVSTTDHDNPHQVNRTVDELMQDHQDFLDSCLRECMLTQGKLLKLLYKLILCCNMFTAWSTSFSRHLQAADPDLDGPKDNEASLAKLDENLKRYEVHFEKHMKIMVDSLNYYSATETSVLLQLANRLSNVDKDEVRSF